MVRLLKSCHLFTIKSLIIVGTIFVFLLSPFQLTDTFFIHAQSISPLLEQIYVLSDKYGIEPSLAISIIRCESGGNMNALNRNKNGTIDFSYWQLNSIWAKSMYGLGWNIYKPEENLEAGFYILSIYGVLPWKASAPCRASLAQWETLTFSNS